jgi:succinylglutamate desuccinylase
MKEISMDNIPRIIGEYTSDVDGPLLFVTAAVHGNEPSGAKALKRVFEELNKAKPKIKGKLIGVAGNQKALNKNQRFIDEDLNRTWTEDNIKNTKKETHEQREMHEIIKVLEQHPESSYSKRYFLDCHTTSSDSLPYISVQDVNDNIEWAQRFPTYIVEGFSDIVYGAIDHYFSRIGMTGFTFEAGQHTNKSSEENHEGMIWLALKEACDLDLTKIATYPECVTKFSEVNAPEQKTFEIIHRHGLKDSDEYKTEPGFENFQEIEKGQLIAKQNGNEIRSDWDARIFMPLYQSQGNDGFFVINDKD